MPDTPSLSFRKLEAGEVELALALVASENADDLDSESFGIGDSASPPTGEAWGLWVSGGLAGAAWLRIMPGAEAAEVTALVLARGWRRLGIAAWMLGELARIAAEGGCRELTATIRKGGARLSGILSEAGFAGPGIAEGDSPLGKWSRKCR